VTANQVSNLCPGSYSVEITDANGCTGNQTFTIAAAGGLNLTNSGNVTICSGETTTISASGASSFSWNNGLGNGNSFDVNPTETTIYTATGSSNGCSSATTLTVTVSPSPIVLAGSDVLGCVGDSIQLNATGATNLVWENGIPNGEYLVLEEGSYEFTVVGTTGTCIGMDSIQVTVTNCDWELEMPNVITPNTDIVNDFFVPVSQKNVTIVKTTILNRWGNEVFNTSNPLLIWDGRAQNGQLASEGTYFYMITFVDGTLQSHTKQGYVELVKK
jgi:gliding motility-associated-like protein